jgi:hypothetical protein
MYPEPVECTKVPYGSQREARKQLTKLMRFRAVRGDDRIEVRAYPCPICTRWHLTSLDR